MAKFVTPLVFQYGVEWWSTEWVRYWKICRSWRLCYNFRYSLGIYPDGLTKTARKISQDRRFTWRNLNPRPTNYKAGIADDILDWLTLKYWGTAILQNFGSYSSNDTPSHPRRRLQQHRCENLQSCINYGHFKASLSWDVISSGLVYRHFTGPCCVNNHYSWIISASPKFRLYI
jgi:hypothetical protein